MKIDSDDLKILKEFSNLKKNEKVSLWEMTKRIFKNKKVYDREYNFVRRRILSMSEFGLFEVTRNSPLTFSFNDDKFICKEKKDKTEIILQILISKNNLQKK